MTGRHPRLLVYVFSILVLIGGLLIFSSPFVRPLSAAPTGRTVSLTFVLSSSAPTYNMSLDRLD